MRYLLTSDETVGSLKKQAKALQRAGAGQHSEMLDRVAKEAGYHHWHHVVHCHRLCQGAEQMRAIRAECEAIIAAELRGEAKALMTSKGVACPPFVLFSTGIGDAWLLEPDVSYAMCLVWKGVPQPVGVRDDPQQLEVEWDCTYELMGDFFNVESAHSIVGTSAIPGYPLKEVRMLLDRAQSPWTRMAAILGQVDAVDITPEVVSQMAKQGWSEEELLRLKAEGWRYSPSRNTLLGPVFSSEDDDA